MASDQELELNTLKVNYDNMVKQNTKEHSELQSGIKSVADSVEAVLKKVEGLDGKFAGKWVERVMLFIAITAGTGLLGIIGTIIVWFLKNQDKILLK